MNVRLLERTYLDNPAHPGQAYRTRAEVPTASF